MSEVTEAFFCKDSWRELLKRNAPPRCSTAAPEFRFADLFSGCGGLSLGAMLAAHRLGRRPVVQLAVDNWALAADVYRNNISGRAESVMCADVLDVVHHDVPNLDLLLAGPPCQGHSDLNNSTRRRDPRNELYMAPVEFAVRNMPRMVLIENVPTVIHASQNVIGRAKRTLTEAGYQCFTEVVDVSNLGLPQRRRRHLLIGMLDVEPGEVEARLAPISVQRDPPRLMSFLGDLENRIDDNDPMLATTRLSGHNKERIEYLFSHDVYDLPDALRPACHRDRAHSYSSMYGRMYPDRPAQTLTSGFGSMGQGRFVHPTRPRMITAQEAARIQGFPDYFSFSSVASKSALRQMIANAVPPALSAAAVSLLYGEWSGGRRDLGICDNSPAPIAP